uniref:Elongation factor 1-delta n=1 Tax=Cynoglossus semilaevis TaxID=244447 RepID=A0A3P8UU21_CYNSE
MNKAAGHRRTSESGQRSEETNFSSPERASVCFFLHLDNERVWLDKGRYDAAESQFYQNRCEKASGVKKERSTGANAASVSTTATNTAALSKLECRVALLEKTPGKAAPHKSRVLVNEEDADDDIDLFGSDEDDDEAEKLKAQRLKEYAEKKAKKPALIAKSSILLDVKPWDDETDMVKLEECVRSIQTDGLLWGTSKLVPVGYGIKKLQIACVVEDDKVGTDLLEEEITKFEDFVQSVDVAAFNKI